MTVRLKDTEKAAPLFGDWPEAIIWSCLQGVMGDVYGDHQDRPQSAMACLGDFRFYGGRPHRGLVEYKPDRERGNYRIMVPQHDGWSELIEDCCGQGVKKSVRYAFRKEKDVFDRRKLREAVRSLSQEYTMRMMDRELFDRCRSSLWSRDLVSQYADYHMYEKLGIGVVILKGGMPVSGASSYARYNDGIEIEIDTRKDHRRRGLAYACGARLILECLERGLYPSWDAHNSRSAALAQKLGYHIDHEYPVYEAGAEGTGD